MSQKVSEKRLTSLFVAKVVAIQIVWKLIDLGRFTLYIDLGRFIKYIDLGRFTLYIDLHG